MGYDAGRAFDLEMKIVTIEILPLKTNSPPENDDFGATRWELGAADPLRGLVPLPALVEDSIEASRIDAESGEHGAAESTLRWLLLILRRSAAADGKPFADHLLTIC